MSANSIITILGISILLIYGITKILEFYGIGQNIYGSYVAFYYFMLLTSFILPRDYQSINFNNHMSLNIVPAAAIISSAPPPSLVSDAFIIPSAPPLVAAADIKVDRLTPGAYRELSL